jgi:GNAT superfamily N-acetyltransferase
MSAPSPHLRRLGPGDEATLSELARDDADFGLDEDPPAAPLSPNDAQEYLADPGVLHWVAEERGRVVGHLACQRLRMRAGDPREVLLYDIGVRAEARRRGVGRALIGALIDWMATNGVREVWVLTEEAEAMAFYRACGFEAHDGVTYMIRALAP